jgi:16S rRNA (cytidine1402-2'-O)-methyltransferase
MSSYLNSSQEAPIIFMLPVPIAENEKRPDWIGPHYVEILKSVRLCLAENPRTARRFFSSLKVGIDLNLLEIEVLDKDADAQTIQSLIKKVKEYGKAILVSESGCPGIADPGAKLAELAHQSGIIIKPVVGPTSIILALMASGLSGQKFAFQGYLPIDKKQRIVFIKELEKESLKKNQTQIFIETPYRNADVWLSLLDNLGNETRLAFGIDISGPEERIKQNKIKDWKKHPEIEWAKIPCIFLFQA